MGFRLYVTTSEEKDQCFGKLFGYAGADTHLYSLDYLIEIDAFKDWQENFSIWDTTSYEDMVEFFVCAQATDDIYLTTEQYNRFILLYRSDQVDLCGTNPEDILELIDEVIYKGGDESIKLEWW